MSGSGKESRLRQKVIGVRLSPAELELLEADATRSGRTLADELRQAFIGAQRPSAAIPDPILRVLGEELLAKVEAYTAEFGEELPDTLRLAQLLIRPQECGGLP